MPKIPSDKQTPKDPKNKKPYAGDIRTNKPKEPPKNPPKKDK